MFQRMNRRIRKQFQRPSAADARRVRQVGRGLEALENRHLLATIPWVGAVDSNWSNPANWGGGVVPDSTSDVEIGSAYAGRTIAVNSNVSIRSLNSAASLTILGGTFNLTTGSSSIANLLTISGSGKLNSNVDLTAGSIAVNGGTWHQTAPANVNQLSMTSGRLDGPGNIAVGNSFSWTGGILGGIAGQVEGKLSLAAGASGSIGGSSNKFVGREFENSGALTYNGTGLYLGFGGLNNNVFNGVLTNLASGSVTVQGNSSFFYDGSGSSGTINNWGTLNHVATGTSTLSTGIRLNNTGRVSVDGGTLSVLNVTQLPLSGATKTLAGGTWNVSANSTLSLGRLTTNTITTNNANVTLAGATSVFANINSLSINNGRLELRDGRSFATVGALTNNGSVNVDAASKLSVAGDFVQSTTGILSVETPEGANQADHFYVSGQSTLDGTVAIAPPKSRSLELPPLPSNPDMVALFVSGLLYVEGSAGNDVIVIRQNQDTVTIDGFAETIPAADLHWIVVNALGGDDVVVLASELLGGDPILAPSLLDGGTGNDLLLGGAGIDWLFGGLGNDYLDGGAGNDLLYGDDGTDVLLGGAGNDLLAGGGGFDLIDGQAGCDSTYDDWAYKAYDAVDYYYASDWSFASQPATPPATTDDFNHGFGDLQTLQAGLDEIFRQADEAPNMWEQEVVPGLGITMETARTSFNEWRIWHAG